MQSPPKYYSHFIISLQDFPFLTLYIFFPLVLDTRKIDCVFFVSLLLCCLLPALA